MEYLVKAHSTDPGNFLVLTQLGIKYIKSYRYGEAAHHLQAAVDQVTHNHTKPRHAEPLYYLGLAHYLQGEYDAAYDLLYRATWNESWSSPSYCLIARIDCIRGEYCTGLEHAGRAVRANYYNLEAQQLQAILLRKTGRKQEALEALEGILEQDPLNYVAHYEMQVLEGNRTGRPVSGLLRNEADSYLELASRYMQAGMHEDAITILEKAGEMKAGVVAGTSGGDPGTSPMISYYTGYCCHKLGDMEKMADQYRKGNDLPVDYCFPYGIVSERVLQDAIRECPDQPEPYYYLGNLYCDHRPDSAYSLWKKAAALDPGLAVCHRNIAFVTANILDRMDEAWKEISEAIRLDPGDPLYREEADRYAAYMDHSPQERLGFMETATEIILQSDGATARYINLLVLNGRFDDAIDILSERHFHSAEASDINLHVQWADAHILRGRYRLEAGEAEQAVDDFTRAMEFPLNLESARDGKIAIALYYLGLAMKQQGNTGAAEENFQNLIDFESTTGWGTGEWPEIMYCQAKAWSELGQPGRAGEIYRKLISDGQEMLGTAPHQAADMRSVQKRHDRIRSMASGHYRLALGYLGQNKRSQAREHLARTLKLDPSHVGACNYFSDLLTTR